MDPQIYIIYINQVPVCIYLKSGKIVEENSFFKQLKSSLKNLPNLHMLEQTIASLIQLPIGLDPFNFLLILKFKFKLKFIDFKETKFKFIDFEKIKFKFKVIVFEKTKFKFKFIDFEKTTFKFIDFEKTTFKFKFMKNL